MILNTLPNLSVVEEKIYFNGYSSVRYCLNCFTVHLMIKPFKETLKIRFLLIYMNVIRIFENCII